MKKAILLILFSHFLLTAQSQNSTYPKVPFTTLYEINESNGNIYTAGGCDIIMVSEDDGENWTTIETSTYGLMQIEIVPNSDGEKAYYLFRSKIYIFDMASKSFEDISDDNLNSLSDNFKKIFIKGDDLYIIDDIGLFKAKIGDYVWEKYMGFTFDEGYILRSDNTANYVWLGMSNGAVIKVDLEHKTKTEIHKFERRVYTVEMANDDTGYFTYQSDANIYKTSDGGNTFFPLDGMPETSSPVALGENILMTINTNRIYVSTDGGASSQYFAMPTDGLTGLNSGHLLKEDTTLYLVGVAGMVLKSEDLCQSFTHLNPIQREDLQSIYLADDGEGYAVGGENHVVHTSDGGENWTAMDLGIANNYYQSVVAAGTGRFLIGSDKGILTMENNTLINTDPWACYVLYDSPISHDIYAVRNISGLTLSKSSDQGDTWTDLCPLSNNAYHLQQSSSGRLFTVDAERQLIYTDDEGANWNSLAMDGFDGSVSTFYFLDDTNGIISAGNQLYKTTDGGNTVTNIAGIYGIDNLYMFSTEHFIYTYATNNWTSIQETTDGGQSWTNTGFFCTQSFGSFYDGEETVWYAQKGGHINQHSILKTSAIKTPHENLNTLTVSPNPLKVGEDFTITHDELSTSSIQIFDISGKLQQQINHFQAGEKIRTNDLAAGTYIIKCVSSKNEQSIAKLVLYE